MTEFAARLSTDENINIVPPVRASLVSFEKTRRCPDHFDNANGRTISTKVIGGYSFNTPSEQIRMNWSSRRSQEGYIFRTKQDKILKYIEEYYRSLTDSRKTITYQISEGSVENFLPGFSLSVKRCHLRPTGFYSLCLYCQELLYTEFHLSHYEMTSVVFVIKATCPNSHLFLAMATQILVHKYSHENIPWDGHDFGFMLHKLMYVVKELFLKEKDRSKHWERFKDQRFKRLLTLNKVREGSIQTCKHSLWLYSNLYKEPRNQKDVFHSYGCIIKHDTNLLVGTGSLSAQHSMSLNSILGFYPSWIRSQAILSPDSRTVKFFNENFELSQKLDKKECSLFLPTQLHYMKEQLSKEGVYCDLPSKLLDHQ